MAINKVMVKTKLARDGQINEGFAFSGKRVLENVAVEFTVNNGGFIIIFYYFYFVL